MKRIPPNAPVQSVIADLTGPKDLVGTNVPNYGTFPLTLGHTFDFVLIDGRRRLECALTAFVASSPSTVVVLHDYLRVRYRPMTVLFETLETGPQFLVMRARPDLLHGTAVQRAHLLDEYQRSGKNP